MLAELSTIRDMGLFIARLRAYIAAIMRLIESVIANIRLTPGSIVVEFDMAPTSEARQGVLNLQQAIRQDEFAFEPAPGAAPLSADPESFACTGDCAVEESGMSLGVIIGVAVGGGVALVLMVAALVVLVVRRRSVSRNRVDGAPPRDRPVTFHYINSAYGNASGGANSSL